MNLPNGTLLQGGKYRIQRFISSGGFGCTYEAINTYNQQRVAIKELFVKDVSDRDEHTLTISAYSTNKSVLLNKIKKKFLEEANALKAMSHPNIVRVHESFEENGTAYYVMDYIDGQSLHDIIKQSGALSESRSLKYINQVADALAYVHARNRLHLDIKPGNIMIDSHDKVVLIDFGVSKQYDEANGENTSTLIGKSPGYSPVEQLGNNVQQFSPATDIYALGATLYKCVTGNTPPDATTVLSDGLPELPHSISNNIRETIKKSMSPIKGNRPQSIKAFLDNLKTSTQGEGRAYLNFIMIALSGFFGLIFCAKMDAWNRIVLRIEHHSHDFFYMDYEQVESLAYILMACSLITSVLVIFDKKHTGRIALTITTLFLGLMAYSGLDECAELVSTLRSGSDIIPIPDYAHILIVYIVFIGLASVYQYKYINSFHKKNSNILYIITFFEVFVSLGLTFFYLVFHAG